MELEEMPQKPGEGELWDRVVVSENAEEEK